MHRRLLRACLLILAVFVGDKATAAIIRVPVDEPTIQQGIDAARNKDVVQVGPGTYFEHINFHGKAITVKSTNGPRQTFIDGSKNGTVVTFLSGETIESKLIGFTIQHGAAFFGAGMIVEDSSATIEENIFQFNVEYAGGFGAAISVNNASPIIENNIFIKNNGDSQLLSGVAVFVNGSSPLVINNLFLGNSCPAINTYLQAGFTPVFAHNTIVKNSVGISVAEGISASTQLYANNILVGNDVGLLVVFATPGNEPIWENNLVFRSQSANYSGTADLTGTNGNISLDPKFVDVSSANVALLPGSPAIDAGTLMVPGLPATDILRQPRVVDGDGDGVALPDMGAVEFAP